MAHALGRLGLDVYLPLEARICRSARKGGKQGQTITEVPLLPKAVLADVPQDREMEVYLIRHLEYIFRDNASNAIELPDWQVTRFREYVDARNAAIRKQFTANLVRREKKQWVKLTASTLPEVLNRLFGKEEREAA